MKLCLAGLYSSARENRELLSDCRFMLESFFSFKEWQIPYIKNQELFLLDSGAFTFMAGNAKHGQSDFDAYLGRYIDFINGNDVDHFFELDIDPIVGYKKVLEMRERLEGETGKRCIPVWHKSRGLDEWYSLVESYGYVAIGGFVTKEIQQRDYRAIPKLLHIARANGCKVHGLGFTNKVAYSMDFYSVDSTSWVAYRKFGKLYQFNNGEMITIPTPDNHRMKKGEPYKTIERHTLLEWYKLQDFLDKRGAGNVRG